ncbi:5-formyltetrahydrofolate cyclo-ligase [soil metagenome]
MNKESIKKIYLEKRKRLSPEELEFKNKKIQYQLFQGIDFSTKQIVHTFLPIQKSNEINIWPIITYIRGNFKDIKIIISKSDFKTLEMTHYLYKENTILLENDFGIPEPHQGEIYLKSEFDIILIPLVAFDLQGHRVGYGKGFYDRFLITCNPETIKVGLSLFDPVPKIMDLNEHDIGLDHCATPESFYTFKK